MEIKTPKEVRQHKETIAGLDLELGSMPLNTRESSLLSGIVFCGHCGARSCVTTSGKGRKSKMGQTP